MKQLWIRKKSTVTVVMLGLAVTLGILLLRPAPAMPGRSVAEVGENEAEENEALLGMGDYWATRVTYPTGQFSQQWLLEAAEHDKTMPQGVPAGVVTYQRNASPLALDPNQFTSLGPQ